MSLHRKAKKPPGFFKTKKRRLNRQRRFERRVYAPCVECHGDGLPVLGADFKPDDPYAARRVFYVCECGAWIGSTADGLPQGYPAGHQTRIERGKAHNAFRLLLAYRVFPDAKAVISWTAEQLGVDPALAFVSKMDASTANRVTRLMLEKLHETRKAVTAQDTAESEETAERPQIGYTRTFGEETPDFLQMSIAASLEDNSPGAGEISFQPARDKSLPRMWKTGDDTSRPPLAGSSRASGEER